MVKTRVFDLENEYEEALEAAVGEIINGGLVAFPTETVYGIGADAMNETAVRKIFTAKGRPGDNPLIVHIARIEQAEKLACMTPLAKKLTEAFWPGPFTAVMKRRACVPDAVTGGLDTVGVRLPSNKVIRDLVERSGKYIAAPSANLSGKPSPTRAAHVLEDFSGVLPVILDGGDCTFGVESTVCDCTGDVPVILRPGGVTKEMIENAWGCAEVDKAVLEGMENGAAAASPGMKYKHYSPKAQVYIADGDDRNAIAKKVKTMYDNSNNAVILCERNRQPIYGGRNTIDMGEDSAGVARSLFGALRDADEMGYETVIFEAVSLDGMGLAVMNRALRAAAFKKI